MNCGHKWGTCLLLHGGHECVLPGGHVIRHRCACGAADHESEG